MRHVVLGVLLPACSFEHGFAVGMPGGDAGRRHDAPVADAAIDAAPTFVVAYNVAGPAHTGTDFPGMWAADPGICDGLPYTINVDVTNTVDDLLFTRYEYAFETIECALGTNLPPATYEITLLFGELFTGPGCAENNVDRVFDVLVEGTVVEDNLNTVTVGGCCHPSATTPGKPFARVYTREISDGTVDISLRPEPQQATMISAIMLRRF